MAKLILVGLIIFAISTWTRAQSGSNTEDRQSQTFSFVVYPSIFDGILVESLETPVQFRALLYLNLANWNAWCNFHPTAVDIFGRSRFKRPKSEHTRENKNIAAFYALLRLYESSPQSFGGPSALPSFRKLMRSRGLDPDDRSFNMTSPIGIGNREGLDTARLMKLDGWNAEGDLTGTHPSYKQPFADYTGYTPRNSPWKIKFPFRWQPFLENNGLGFFFRQEHVVPFAGNAIAFGLTPRQVRRRKVRSPYSNRWASVYNARYRDLHRLKTYARKVFKTSANLTEKERLLAELFDNKVNAFKTKENPLGVPSIAAAVRFFVLGPALNWSLDDDIIYGLAANIASFDAMVTVWKEKVRQDAMRPSGQLMGFLFGREKFEVFGGNNRRNAIIEVHEWQPYIRTMPHSEFPSASACACSALIEHALIVTKGRDLFPYNVTFPAGSSKLYPGEFPSKEVTIPIDRLSEWTQLCGESRLWAGVHFPPSVPAGRRLCKGIGRTSQNVVDNLLAGKPDYTWLSWVGHSTGKWWEM